MTESDQHYSCSICKSTEIEILSVKEMRNGWREVHPYRYCLNCGFLELVNIPNNMAKYYENGYYTANKPHLKIQGSRAVFWALRAKYYDRVLHPIWHKLAYNTILDWKHKLKLSFQDEILDYGCGNGDILYEFHKHGFKNLEGLDPFLPESTSKLPFALNKGLISEFTFSKKFKLIMMHHSFEHMPDQQAVLAKLKDLMQKDGKLLIRMPVVNEAFYHYRENWVQIDAPRHFGIHTIKSFELLTKACGFQISEIFYDSTAFQFTGSEQNKADIAFFDRNSFKVNVNESIFSKEDLINYDQKALEYNKSGKGDQAGFILELS
jgi:SAM-dependent methyltransferase